ncbi:hypothetical protein WCLP8_3890008 [uncultured Gammaproteobacteria bacterium]
MTNKPILRKQHTILNYFIRSHLDPTRKLFYHILMVFPVIHKKIRAEFIHAIFFRVKIPFHDRDKINNHLYNLVWIRAGVSLVVKTIDQVNDSLVIAIEFLMIQNQMMVPFDQHQSLSPPLRA